MIGLIIITILTLVGLTYLHIKAMKKKKKEEKMNREAIEELINETKARIEVEIAEVLDKQFELIYDLCIGRINKPDKEAK